jgi:hypothetical protein
LVDGVEDESQVRFDGGDGAFDESDEDVDGVGVDAGPVVPIDITFMDNRGNIFVLDEFIEQMNSYIWIRTCEFINR